MRDDSGKVPNPKLRLEHGQQKTLDLGELLVAHRSITQPQLRKALAEQQESGQPLRRILLSHRVVTEEGILKVVAAQSGIRPWHLERDAPHPDAIRQVPADLCRKRHVLPVKVRGDVLILAMRDPADMMAIEAVRTASGKRVEPVLADEDRLVKAIEAAYGGKARMDDLVSEALGEAKDSSSSKREQAMLSEADTRPVVGLVNQLLGDAIKLGASDVHIEPRAGRVDIRYRVDGRLQKVREIPIGILQMLTTRLKIMAELDIVEWRVPQDGRMSVGIDGRSVDVRVSILPNYHGQRISLRILDSSVSLRNLEEIGFSEPNLALFRSMIHKPYGMVLVTGPTGSGKTTTLYAALNELREVATNIMTCEDPVEYDIDGINQSQVNEKVGLTFALQLRAMLRQDPDVILVGEIRDKETADTAIRAALTGHLVLSTLHSNDAPSAVPRLIDMGVDPYLLSTSLIGVVAQRLIRKLCPSCRIESEIDLADIEDSEDATVYREGACKKCGNTGFKGRLSVHEIMPVTPSVASAITTQAPVEEVRRLAASAGFRPLQLDTLDRVLRGETSLKESQRHVFFELNPASQLGRQAAA